MEEDVSIEDSIKSILKLVVFFGVLYLLYKLITPSVKLDCGTDTDCWNNVTSEFFQEMEEDLEDGVLDGSYRYDYNQIRDKVDKISNRDIRYTINRNITNQLDEIEYSKQVVIMDELQLEWN